MTGHDATCPAEALMEDAVAAVRRHFRLGFLAVMALPAFLFPVLLKITELPPAFAPYARISWPTMLYVVCMLPLTAWLLDRRLGTALSRTAVVARQRALASADMKWVGTFALECLGVVVLYLVGGVIVVGLDAALGTDGVLHLPNLAIAIVAVVILVVYMVIPLYLLVEILLGRQLGPLLGDGVVTRAWIRFGLSGPGVVVVTLASLMALFWLLGMPLDAGVLFCCVTLTVYAVLVSAIAQFGENRALEPLFRYSAEQDLGPEARARLLESSSVDEIGQLVRDVRRLAEGEQVALAQARASEQRFRQFAEAASDWFFEIDASLDFSWVSDNVERILGVPAESIIGVPAVGMSAVYQDTEFAKHRDDLLAHRPYRNYRFSFTDAAGRERHLEVSGEPVFDDDGEFMGYLGAGSDITDLVEARSSLEARTAELMQAQKMEAVGQLTGGIAHDFNNLLTVVLGNLELAAHIEPDEADELQQALAEAAGAAQRGADLVRRLMAFSRKQTLQPERVRPTRLVDTMTPLLRSALGENIELAVDGADDALSCFCDPGQLENALLNLAINARDAMPAGGRLTVAIGLERIENSDLLAPGPYVRIDIADTGCGIEENQLALVFEPFFTTKSQGEGTGLGLSMVYGFARQSGGTVRIESTLGEGTTITLLLPVEVAGEAEERARAQQRAETIRGDGEHVLVVEDEPAVRTLVVKQLERLGFVCQAFGTTREALAVLEGDDRVDVLLSDIVLAEESNGIELARRARDLRPELPVVFMTGYTHQFDELESEHFVTKPFTVNDLAAMLRRSLGAAGGSVPNAAPEALKSPQA